MNELNAINELTVIFYYFFCWLFIAIAIFVFKQKNVDIARRKNVSGINFFIGAAFAFAGGRVITGGDELFIYLVLMCCFGFTYFVVRQAISIYKLNQAIKENRVEQQYEYKSILKTDTRNLAIGFALLLLLFILSK